MNIKDQIRQYSRKMVVVSSVLIIVLGTIMLSASLPHYANSAYASSSLAHGNSTQFYDPIVLPISEPELHEGLIHNCENAEAEYQLLLRAGYQHEEQVAYDTMKQLQKEQTSNPIVLVGYFMALKMAEGGVNSMFYNGGHQVISGTPSDDTEAQALLEKAYQLNPKFWLTYAVDGENKFYDSPTTRGQGLALLQKAESLAPSVPYVHWLLGNAYASPPLSEYKYQIAAKECKQALASGARISNAAFILFQIYSLWMPDQAEEIHWKRKYLSLVPPDVKMNPLAKQWLDKYPG